MENCNWWIKKTFQSSQVNFAQKLLAVWQLHPIVKKQLYWEHNTLWCKHWTMDRAVLQGCTVGTAHMTFSTQSHMGKAVKKKFVFDWKVVFFSVQSYSFKFKILNLAVSRDLSSFKI